MARPTKWQNAIQRIDDVFSGANSLDKLFAGLDDTLADGFSDNFDSRSDDSGAAWPAHAPSTVKRYGPHPLLELSGRMRRAATNPSDPEHLSERVGDTLRSGVKGTIKYAIFHQVGTSKMPRRQFIYATTKTILKLKEKIRLGVKAAMRV